tara:strand:- start:606 stop:1718 length:1113 start_codon:yes stop_codon:yes gene_type:complete
VIINHVKANHFKNYELLSLSFSPDCNVIYGLNGSGKTNLLDLIHFLCLGKSYFSITDKQALNYAFDYFRLEADLESDEKERLKIAVSVPSSGRKKIWRNGDALKKNTELLGLIPIVCIVPDDIELIKGSSIVRRKFMDRVLCQLSKDYTNALINYERALKQKLALLKNTSSIHELDHVLIQTYDELLWKHGKVINASRNHFCKTFEPKFDEMYTDIAGKNEKADIHYESNFSIDTFLSDSKENREIDFYSKRVRKGTHRDDVVFKVNSQNVRKFASQGQMKTFIYALKFSEYLFLSDQSERRPILLLDDIFEKLDKARLQHLFELMTSSRFGQIFITDTEQNRSIQLLKELNISYFSFRVEKNIISQSNG